MTFDKEFKKALSLIPDKEKDKLILRLLKRDLRLARRLEFELVDTRSVEERRELIQTLIIQNIEEATRNYFSLGYLLKDIRRTSGIINEHVFITKDKFGEISLNCTLLRYLISLNQDKISSTRNRKLHTLCIYIISRMYKILILMQKQHEDLYIEFEDDIKEIGKLISNNKNLKETALQNRLNIDWLINFDIPDDMAIFYKELRKDGLLR